MARILAIGVERADLHMKIEAKHLVRTFGTYLALDNVSLKIEEGELVALLGPSGSGKTTLLRIFAGLDFPDSGSVLFDDQDATGLRIQTRRVGFVFQNYALFRHMTIYKNIAFGLEVDRRKDRLKPALIRERVFELLRLVQLAGFENRLPAQLSGGQRQRVALARALAIEPRVLLLDEPFGALDAMVRKELRSWVKQLQRQLKITTLFVTHDQDEAIEIADRIVVMNTGRIEQFGTPNEVCEEPATPFVLEFLQGQATGQEFRSSRSSGVAEFRAR
jgi:sulfate/thiosulfate transport system ATP-binding protein